MINIHSYMSTLLSSLLTTFKDRLVYVGLQGSYLRGEAHDGSDIDVMVILKDFTAADMNIYKEILHTVGNEDLSCGFICGLEEFRNWNPMEICQLLYTTKDYHGTLADLVPAYTLEDERNFVKMSLNNLFHEICHRYIHRPIERSLEALPSLYKPILYCMQNLHYLETGKFILKHGELAHRVCKEDQRILQILEKKEITIDDFETVFSWCQQAMLRI